MDWIKVGTAALVGGAVAAVITAAAKIKIVKRNCRTTRPWKKVSGFLNCILTGTDFSEVWTTITHGNEPIPLFLEP